MNDEQIKDNLEKKKKILVSLPLSLIEQVTQDGSTIQDKIRQALESKDGGTTKAKTRYSIKQVKRVLELCKREGLKINIESWNERPLLICDYREGKPKLLWISSLEQTVQYLEKEWSHLMMKRLSD